MREPRDLLLQGDSEAEKALGKLRLTALRSLSQVFSSALRLVKTLFPFKAFLRPFQVWLELVGATRHIKKYIEFMRVRLSRVLSYEVLLT